VLLGADVHCVEQASHLVPQSAEATQIRRLERQVADLCHEVAVVGETQSSMSSKRAARK